MSNVQIQTPAAATNAAATGSDLPPFDSSAIDAMAGQMLALVVQMEGLVPNLTPHDARQIRRVAATARFAKDLIVPTITTVTTVPTPQGLFDVNAAREAMAFREKIGPIVQRLSVLVGTLGYTSDEKLATTGEGCLQTYRWAKVAVKSGKRNDLQPYVDEMARMVRKAINHRPTKSTPGTPAPAPNPPGTPPAPPHAQTFMAMRTADIPGDVERELPDSWYDAVAGEA